MQPHIWLHSLANRTQAGFQLSPIQLYMAALDSLMYHRPKEESKCIIKELSKNVIHSIVLVEFYATIYHSSPR